MVSNLPLCYGKTGLSVIYYISVLKSIIVEYVVTIGGDFVGRQVSIGAQDFASLIENNCFYVDKSSFIRDWWEGKDSVTLITRPRRFGKSLLISTLDSYFSGDKELFKGLAIEMLETEWIKYPVLHFDMSMAKYHEEQNLHAALNFMLGQYEAQYGLETDKTSRAYGTRLTAIILKASQQTGRKVVVLIDEYDAPLLDTMVDDATFQLMRNTMRDFYSPLKACDAYLQFVFLTGITKFSQLSIFSELNNINNISMDNAYSGICGITKTEVLSNFKDELAEMSANLYITIDELLERLKQKFDGYHFSKNSEDIYNPFSLLNALQDNALDNYWFTSGTPTHLAEQIYKYKIDPRTFDDGFAATTEMFDVPTETASSPIPILYQAGYLTIKNYRERGNSYILGYPNEEVRQGFTKCLMPYYTKQGIDKNDTFLLNFTDALYDNNIDMALSLMRAFMSSIPYDAEKQNELHYRTIIYLVFRIATPYFVSCEERSAAGRSDVVVETDEAVYVFEFKLDGSVDEALRQIDDKGYLVPYSAKGKKLYKVGVNFDNQLRTIAKWKVVEG